MDTSIKQPFSNSQVEIIKAFNHDLNEEELREFKVHIAHFFADKLTQIADKVWGKENWDESEILNTKLRKKSF